MNQANPSTPNKRWSKAFSIARTIATSAIAAMVFATSFTSAGAHAAACPAAPSNWIADDCTIDGNTVCTYTGGVASCDVSWSTAGAVVNMVTDYDPLNYLVQAWGDATYLSGGVPTTELFCCPLQPTATATGAPTDVEIIGSPYADTLRFTWINGGSTYTQSLSTNDHTYGDAGNDTIVGSISQNVYDHLYGDTYDDTINALAGHDELFGGRGDDTMNGGADNDYMEGNDDHDIMLGGDGLDEMYGNDGRDFMSGGNNDDYMDGGAAGDVMCGDNEDTSDPDDQLYDGDSAAETPPDLLWSAQVGDKAICSNASTKWDGAANAPGTTCVIGTNPVFTPPIGSTRPLDCP